MYDAAQQLEECIHTPEATICRLEVKHYLQALLMPMLGKHFAAVKNAIDSLALDEALEVMETITS